MTSTSDESGLERVTSAVMLAETRRNVLDRSDAA